ncbi:hypothetical protein ABKN59_000010 [Abortiporus biennis]
MQDLRSADLFNVQPNKTDAFQQKERIRELQSFNEPYSTPPFRTKTIIRDLSFPSEISQEEISSIAYVPAMQPLPEQQRYMRPPTQNQHSSQVFQQSPPPAWSAQVPPPQPQYHQSFSQQTIPQNQLPSSFQQQQLPPQARRGSFPDVTQQRYLTSNQNCLPQTSPITPNALSSILHPSRSSSDPTSGLNPHNPSHLLPQDSSQRLIQPPPRQQQPHQLQPRQSQPQQPPSLSMAGVDPSGRAKNILRPTAELLERALEVAKRAVENDIACSHADFARLKTHSDILQGKLQRSSRDLQSAHQEIDTLRQQISSLRSELQATTDLLLAKDFEAIQNASVEQELQIAKESQASSELQAKTELLKKLQKQLLHLVSVCNWTRGANSKLSDEAAALRAEKERLQTVSSALALTSIRNRESTSGSSTDSEQLKTQGYTYIGPYSVPQELADELKSILSQKMASEFEVKLAQALAGQAQIRGKQEKELAKLRRLLKETPTTPVPECTESEAGVSLETSHPCESNPLGATDIIKSELKVDAPSPISLATPTNMETIVHEHELAHAECPPLVHTRSRSRHPSVITVKEEQPVDYDADMSWPYIADVEHLPVSTESPSLFVVMKPEVVECSPELSPSSPADELSSPKRPREIEHVEMGEASKKPRLGEYSPSSEQSPLQTTTEEPSSTIVPPRDERALAPIMPTETVGIAPPHNTPSTPITSASEVTKVKEEVVEEEPIQISVTSPKVVSTPAQPAHSHEPLRIDTHLPTVSQINPGRPTPQRSLSIRHLELLYDNIDNQLKCRACLERMKKADIRYPVTCFKSNETWPTLSSHYTVEHPAACESLLSMSPSQISFMIKERLHTNTSSRSRKSSR